MTTLTEKFTALEEQLAAQAATTDSYIDTTEAKLQLIADELDTQTVNNAANTRAILNALLGSNPCNDCPSVPIIGEPPITAPQPINADKCKRVQAFLHTMSLFADIADASGTIATVFTPGFITASVEQVRIWTDDSGIPIPGWLDSVAIAADGVNFVVNRALFGGGAHEVLDPLLVSLQAALYAADSPSDAKSTYDAMIDSGDGLAAAKPLLKGIAFGDLVNYFLDPSSTPNLTGYDGSVCGLPPGCLEFTNEDCITQSTEDGPKVIPDWTIYGLPIDTNFGHDNYVWVLGNWRGWSWTITDNGAAVYHGDTHGHQTGTDLTGTWTTAIDEVEAITFVSSASFTLEFCPPA